MRRIVALSVLTLLATVLGNAPTFAQDAYITNSGSDSVSVIDTTTNTVIATIPVGSFPRDVAVTPDGSKVYVANTSSNSVSVIATAANTVIATIPNPGQPEAVAVTPDGSFVYVANFNSGTVSVIATATNTVIGSPITVGTRPIGVAVTPDGSKVYVANLSDNTVSVIATASNTVVGSPITVGTQPYGLAVTPDGSKVYVANSSSPGTVSVIATATNTVIGSPITVGIEPEGVAVTPDGSKVYAVNEISSTVSVIATASNTVTATITVGTTPEGVAVTPDGSKVYVANEGSNTVSVIGTATNTVIGSPITVGTGPVALGSFIGPALTSETLTIAESGTGSGQVTSSPAGISCSASSNQCAAGFAVGTQVTLTASASAGSSFSGWSGGGCSGTGSCVVTMNSAQSVSASFIPFLSPLVASVMPSSQSVEVGSPATATATLINGGNAIASQCAVAPIGTLPATFSYQAVPGGNANTPVDIPAGGTASFNISLTPTAAILPGVNVQFSFSCANTPQATIVTGVNTLFLSAATTPVANIVATAAVANNSNGILVLNQTGANTGAASFAVSTINQGIGASITASANLGAASLPVTITLCPTDPNSGQCITPPGPSTTLTINSGDSPTFAVFVTATGPIPFDLNNNRIFVQFTSTTTSQSAAPATHIASPNAANTTATTIINGVTSVSLSFTPSNPSAGSSPLAAALLPLSRSVEAGATPTVFATIINPNATTATSCAISQYPLPASFLYQTTDPTTNALTGTPNTPVDIPAGQAQSFVVALNPTAVFGPTNVELGFSCNNALAAIDLGVNTLSLSASATPVPDVIALAASGDPGYVDIPGATGTGDFAVATVNLGIDATITAAANTGTANLPITLTLCQTDPQSGGCLAAPAASVTTDIEPNATPTFGIFVTGSAAVANLPGVNRVFVSFTDSNGVLRGETSVAVRTQ